MRCLHYASIIAWFGTAILFGVFFNKPPPELPPPPDTCSRRGFLWRKCSDGCVRQGSVCVPDRRLYAGLRMPMGVTEVSRRPSPARAHDLMKKRTVPNCLAAADIFEAAARAAHADAVAAAELKLMAGNALNCAMRIRGSGNILLLDGTLDTPANKKFWGEHLPSPTPRYPNPPRRRARAARTRARPGAHSLNDESRSPLHTRRGLCGMKCGGGRGSDR